MTTRVIPPGCDGELLAAELPSGEALRGPTEVEGAFMRDAEILRLLSDALRELVFDLRRVDVIETKDVFVAVVFDVKAIAVVRDIGNQPAVLEFLPPASGKHR